MSRERIVHLPYLHDHHSHVSLYASFEGLPDLSGLDRAGAMRLLGGLPRDRLNLVKGWRTERLPLGGEALAGFPPLIVVNASLHGYALSPDATPLLADLWPEFAERADDSAWGEGALSRLFTFYSRLAGLDGEKLARFMSRMETLGLGSLEDMTITGEEELDIVAASPYAERIQSWATPEVYRGLSAAARARCSGIKIFLDGSLGAKSAALDRAFSDGTEGHLLYGDDDLSTLLADLALYRTGLSAHALGHEAIGQILRCVEGLSRDGIAFPSLRLEHVQFISSEQALRCKETGIVLSVQPNFNSDSRDYADRLDPRHLAQNDPFRMLIDDAGFVPGRICFSARTGCLMDRRRPSAGAYFPISRGNGFLWRNSKPDTEGLAAWRAWAMARAASSRSTPPVGGSGGSAEEKGFVLGKGLSLDRDALRQGKVDGQRLGTEFPLAVEEARPDEGPIPLHAIEARAQEKGTRLDSHGISVIDLESFGETRRLELHEDDPGGYLVVQRRLDAAVEDAAVAGESIRSLP